VHHGSAAYMKPLAQTAAQILLDTSTAGESTPKYVKYQYSMCRTFGTRIVSGARISRPSFGLVFAKTGSINSDTEDSGSGSGSYTGSTVQLAANLLKNRRNWF
jgi:hypothetical protein